MVRAGPHREEKLITNEASTRRTFKKADAADAQRVKERKQEKLRAQVAAATATDDECRSVEESTSAQVAHLKQQLEVAGRAEAEARVDRDNSSKAKAVVDR